MKGKPVVISRSEACRLAVASQGLHSARPFGSGKRAVYNAIAHLGYVQIDTISVTERAHHHVLWSRASDYRTDHLTALQVRDRRVLEYWAHAAAIIPMDSYRFCLPTMDYFRKHHDPWPKADHRTMRFVLDRIRAEGPLKSRDFEHAARRGASAWWDWKPAKLALQRLFFKGDILISHREGFQRVYDIPERILPSHINTTPPSPEEYARHLIQGALRAHGLVRAQEISYLRRGLGELVRKTLGRMTSAGEVVEVAVEGVAGTFFTTEEQLAQPVRIARHVKLLSPFDNLVIQRNRVRDLFAFDYQIEMYVPRDKRKYGYYCLPVLMGDQCYGRVDVKAERKQKELQVVHVHLEDKKLPQDLDVKLAGALTGFAAFNRCDRIRIRKSNPREWKGRLETYL